MECSLSMSWVKNDMEKQWMDCCSQYLDPSKDSHHLPISWSDMVDIFGPIHAEGEGSKAPETSQPADGTAPRARSVLLICIPAVL